MVAAILGLIALAVPAKGQTQDLFINTFDYAAAGTGSEWGTGSANWDEINGNPAGSLLVTAVFSGSSDTALTEYICLNGGNPWYVPTAINLSQYKSLQFDISWDNTSDITIDEFNNLSTWPTSLTNSLGQAVFQNWAASGYLAGSIGGLEIDLCGGPVGQMAPVVATTNIPAAASNGWIHIRIPINQSQANIDGISGIVMHKWINQNWGIQNPAAARFWIDNVMLEGTAVAPPPTVLPPVAAIPGLNVFASTQGNGYFDRQEVKLRQSSGLTWVGQATAGNPVSYSFTIVGYPNSVNCKAFLFLVPNPAANDNAPDWNETNCAIAYIQGDSTSATMRFQYKVNEANQQAMYGAGTETRGSYTNAPGSWNGVTSNYFESGDLGFVTNNGVLGTWMVEFDSDSSVTLIAPNGNRSSSVMPAYNVGYFGESTGFNVYLGMQANQADAMNQAVVFSKITISGTQSPFSEDFLSDSSLDSYGTWDNSVSGGPKGVLVVPCGSPYWVSWTLPAAGYSLIESVCPTTNALWNCVTSHAPISMSGVARQLISANDATSTSGEFFQLVKRTFAQLQVLLPGESNAPNTPTGKSGTPTPVSVAVNSGEIVLTVLAVDAQWNPVSSVNDNISLSSSDLDAILPIVAPLVNGSARFTLYLQDTGDQTVTATDSASPGIPAATTSQVSVTQ